MRVSFIQNILTPFHRSHFTEWVEFKAQTELLVRPATDVKWPAVRCNCSGKTERVWQKNLQPGGLQLHLQVKLFIWGRPKTWSRGLHSLRNKISNESPVVFSCILQPGQHVWEVLCPSQWQILASPYCSVLSVSWFSLLYLHHLSRNINSS